MNFLNTAATTLINIYQKTLSPDKGLLSPRLKGTICAHEPHCSEYAKQCFQKYSFWDALVMSFDRVVSCTPSHMIKKDPSSYKVVFFSGAPIGVPFLKELHENPRFDLQGVVTMPDAARDRGQKLKPNIIKTTATALGINSTAIKTPNSLRTKSKKYGSEARETNEWLTSLEVDFIVVVAYGKLLPLSTLEIPHIGPINVHGSILPEYRGASPLQSVFIDAKKESGVTIMLMDEGMDTGDSISTLKTPLPLDRTVKNLITWIQEKAPAHLSESLRDYAKQDIFATAQDDTLATHCKKIEKSDGEINIYADSLQEIYQKYQAYALWPKVFFHYASGEKIKRAIIEEISVDEETYHLEKANPLTNKNNKTLNPSIKNITIKPEGKKAILRSEFSSNYLT